MRFLSACRSTFLGAVALAALGGDAASLPAGMTLPADYRVRGIATTVMAARYRGQVRTYVRRSRVRDTLTLDDGTFSAADMVGDGLPATGTWTEIEPNVVGRSFDADVGPRIAAVIESRIRWLPGFHDAEVTCTMVPRSVRVRRGGRRLEGRDRIGFKVTGAVARMSGRMVIDWVGRRIEPAPVAAPQ